MTFGALLKRHRRAAGLTQEELAERAGLSRRGINDLERGERLTPRRDTVVLPADALSLVGDERTAFMAAAHRPRREPAPSTAISPSVLSESEAAVAEVASPAPDAELLEPAAILTFLIADVRGHTHITLEQGDEAAARIRRRRWRVL